MSKQVAEFCFDGSPHNFVHQREETRRVGYNEVKTYDVFFCSKCLKQQDVERPKQPEYRW